MYVHCKNEPILEPTHILLNGEHRNLTMLSIMIWFNIRDFPFTFGSHEKVCSKSNSSKVMENSHQRYHFTSETNYTTCSTIYHLICPTLRRTAEYITHKWIYIHLGYYFFSLARRSYFSSAPVLHCSRSMLYCFCCWCSNANVTRKWHIHYNNFETFAQDNVICALCSWDTQWNIPVRIVDNDMWLEYCYKMMKLERPK